MQIDHAQLLKFLLLSALIIVAAKGAGWLILRLGQPAVLGEILAGVVLGPSLLNVLEWPAFRGAGLDVVVAQLANVGVIFLMFIAGLETNLAEMRRVGRVATVAGTAGVFVPLVLGMLAALQFGVTLEKAIFIGIVLAATSVSITVQTLIELGQLESKEGTTLLAAAVIDDVIAIIVLSVFVALSAAEGGVAIGLVVLRMLAFFVLAILGGRWLMQWGLPRSQRVPVSEGLLAFTIVVMLLFSWGAETIGRVAGITGAYIAGVLVTQAGFREEVEHRIRGFTYAVLVPVFFISIGLQTNARLLAPADIPFALLIIVAAVVGKIVGCGGGALLAGFPRSSALRVGVGMISRGEVGLIVAAIGVQAGLLAERGFAVMVIMVLATTIITPVLLRLTFPRRALTEAEALTAVMGDDGR